MSPKLSPKCQAIAAKIMGLENQRKQLQALLQKAAPGEKSSLIAEIKPLTKQINALSKDLEKCKKEHPYVPPEGPPPLPAECAALKKKVAKLDAKYFKELANVLAPLQKQLHTAAPGEKAQILADIRELKAEFKKKSATAKELATATKAYETCIAEHGGLQALDAQFKGKVVFKIDHPDIPKMTRSITIGLNFSEWDHGDIIVTKFPKLKETYDTPIGEVTTTVSLPGLSTGKFNSTTGLMGLTLHLFFAHDTEWAGDSHLDITLTSNKAMTVGGDVSMSGSATFPDGYLEEKLCFIAATGTITPHP